MSEYTYQEVMEAAKRMHETYSCLPACSGCPMKSSNISHCRRVAFEHPKEFAETAMTWNEEHQIGVNEFSTDQERQIDEVMNAAENLIRVLCTKPKYLLGSPLRNYYITGKELPPIHPSEVADYVADMIEAKYGERINIFFPTHLEMKATDGRILEYVRDTYGAAVCSE